MRKRAADLVHQQISLHRHQGHETEACALPVPNRSFNSRLKPRPRQRINLPEAFAELRTSSRPTANCRILRPMPPGTTAASRHPVGFGASQDGSDIQIRCAGDVQCRPTRGSQSQVSFSRTPCRKKRTTMRSARNKLYAGSHMTSRLAYELTVKAAVPKRSKNFPSQK